MSSTKERSAISSGRTEQEGRHRLGRGAIAAIVAVIVLVAIRVRAALLTRREMAQPAALHLR